MSAWVSFVFFSFVLSSLVLSRVANNGDVDIFLAAVPTGDGRIIIIFVVGATTMNASDVHDAAVSNSNTVA